MFGTKFGTSGAVAYAPPKKTDPDFTSELVRDGAPKVATAGAYRDLEVNNNGDLICAQALPERSMLIAQGKSWEGGLSLGGSSANLSLAVGTTAGSTATTMADTTGLVNGQQVSGVGIQPGSYVVSFVVNTSMVLSAKATATGTPTCAFTVLGTGTISAITSGMPTTQVQIFAFNGTQGPVAIDRVAAMIITSSTAGGISIITTGVIPPSSLVGTLATIFSGANSTAPLPNFYIKNLSGKGYYGGNVKLYANGVITAVPSIKVTDWSPLYSLPMAGAAATTLGSVLIGDCFGRYILPPGAGIGFNVMGASALGNDGMWVTWHELDPNFPLG